jgi:hypothetical protein
MERPTTYMRCHALSPILRLRRLRNAIFFAVNAFKAVCMAAAIVTICSMVLICIGGLLLASYGVAGWGGVVFTAFAMCGVFFLYRWGL